jgi:glycosyltransferase involved in cell wall biosynthesis
MEVKKKKKILLLSDDLRMSSGIATVSKELVFGTLDKYDWVQLGAAVEHPEKGKEIDLGEDARNRTGIADASLKIIPWSGYGDANILRELINRHQPDAILHFTDPRYWRWLYEIEAEIRQNVPIFFYHIWDDLPDPKYNRDYYESCDWLGCISKQTYGIVNRVGKIKTATTKPLEDWQVSYVPHGINSETYKPIDSKLLAETKKELFGDKDYKFVLFWMNRNIKRKQPSDVIWAFSKFVEGLPKKDRDDVCLVMHTQPIDQNGTDLFKVKETLAPNCNIIFSNSRINQDKLNQLYNIADATINIAGNEGFGLVTAESVMAGTPIIVNVTGGLQDQCGFKLDGKYLTANDYKEVGSLHDWRKWKDKVTHGEWVKPIWPSAQSMVGSVPTPYIIDDKVDIYETADAIRYWYDKKPKERKAAGLKGREEFLGEMGLNNKNMCQTLIDGMEGAFENWKPKERYNIYKIA